MDKASTDNRAFWQDHIEKQERSGKTIKQYATDHELSLQAFYSWRKRFRGKKSVRPQRKRVKKPEETLTFARVRVAETKPSSSRLSLCIGRVRLEFAELPEVAWLSQLLSWGDGRP